MIKNTNTKALNDNDIIKFNDKTFESIVRSTIKKPIGDIHKSDVQNITELVMTNKGIKNLDGIENFTNLKKLDVSDNELTKLDVTYNKELEYLKFSRNKISSIDVAQNVKLTFLRFEGNQITEIDISHNTALKEVDMELNKLQSIDASKNTELTYLQLSDNELTSLDVSKNTKLNFSGCIRNNLTTLDLSKNINLYSFIAFGNEIKTLYCFKDSWKGNSAVYKGQYTDSAHTRIIKSLTITVKN